MRQLVVARVAWGDGKPGVVEGRKDFASGLERNLAQFHVGNVVADLCGPKSEAGLLRSSRIRC